MKALVPMVASLALCGAGIATLLAGTANADTPRRPMMVAMQTPNFLPQGTVTAAPPADGGNSQAPRPPSTAELAARHKLMCQDAYAHQVGELAYLEVRLNLTPAQEPLFDRWKSAKLDIAKRSQADCATRELPARNARTQPTPLDAIAREQDMLKRRLADLQAEQPPLSALYNSLNADQKEVLVHPEGGSMDTRLKGRHIFAQMGTGPMRQGLMPPGGPGPGPVPRGPRPPALAPQ